MGLREAGVDVQQRTYLGTTHEFFGMTAVVLSAQQAQVFAVARGSRPGTCPVRALEAWLRRARIRYGPVFRRLTAAGSIEGRLTGNGVWWILRARAKGAGMEVDPGERLSPHGLRAGFITEAYLNGALDEQAGAHARQRNLDTTRRYRRRAKVVAASPTRLLDL